jgi:hypothetical protein
MGKVLKFLFGKREYTEEQKAAINDLAKLSLAWTLIFYVFYTIWFIWYIKNFDAFNKKCLQFADKLKESFRFAPDRSESSSDDDTEEE